MVNKWSEKAEKSTVQQPLSQLPADYPGRAHGRLGTGANFAASCDNIGGFGKGDNMTNEQLTSLGARASSPADARVMPEPKNEQGNARYRQRIEHCLDAGHGACVLRRPKITQIVIAAWNYFDGNRYDLHAWVVMPNHVHVLIAMRETSLSDIVHGWKSYTARRINQVLGRTGKFWQEDYWDRYIRNESHYAAAVEYILNNPKKLAPGARASSPAWYVGNAGEDARAPRKPFPLGILEDSGNGA